MLESNTKSLRDSNLKINCKYICVQRESLKYSMKKIDIKNLLILD